MHRRAERRAPPCTGAWGPDAHLHPPTHPSNHPPIPPAHRPTQALGGGDAWVAGFLGRLAEVPLGNAATPADAASRLLQFTPERLHAACRTGDLLAALSQQTHGDFSAVGRRPGL